MESQTRKQGRGRPTKYDEKFPQQLVEYFKSFCDEPFKKEVMSRHTKYYPTGVVKETYEDFKLVSKKLPTLFGFAQSIGVDYSTVQKWSRAKVGKAPDKGEKDTRPFKYPEFFSAYKQAIHFQTEFLTSVGLGGMAPSPFAIFTAKNVINWRDKTETGFTDGKGADVKPGYILLPPRKTDADAEKEYTEQETAGVVPA